MTTFLLCLGLLVALCLMATAGGVSSERHAARAWFDATFLQKSIPVTPAPPGLDVRRQDHGEFHLNKSVLNTPLQIGTKRYGRGLGTHSVSEIIVRLPQAGKRFEAEVGIDNNYDTAGQRGTVVFVVEVAGKEVFQSPLRKGGQSPRPVRVDLNGATEFTLRVLDGGDGPGWDQSDWAAAAVTLKDGKRLWLDELPVIAAPAKIATEPPFSFVYDGKPSAQLLPTWKRSHTEQPAPDGREKHVITYADPATGLEVICEATMFEDYPAVEWLLRLRNTGSADTPMIENIRPLDLRVTAPSKGDVILHHAHGSTCEPTDFLPIDTMVARNADVQIAPRGGRSSNGALPFFNLEWSGGGLVGAIG